jgi:hypothetical protein
MHKSDRGILIGANGTGKSTLADHVLTSFRMEYPDARIMILDTKPRWRATKLAKGGTPRRMYAPLARGDTINGAVSLNTMDDWGLAWDRNVNESQTVIAQRLSGRHDDNVRFQVLAAERFFNTQRDSRPSLLYLDEGMDFFGPNSGARGGSDIVQRCFRAGREKGLATLIGVQRPIGINDQCLTETNWCALFRINFTNDVKRLWEMGWPKHQLPPTYAQKHQFRMWREGAPDAPLCLLDRKERVTA